MAGVVPTKRSASGRKQWTLHDGPKGSLNRLRSQLANDGCAESQVVLAKQLLEEQCDIEVEKRENYRLGVYWLIKSSEQGNTEATELLKTCLSNGKGITEQNYMDVKSCIDMTQDEKLARKAARQMFANLSNGEDYITSQQLQKRMLEIDKAYKSHKGIDNSIYEEFGAGEPSNGELTNNLDETSSESEEEDWLQRPDGHNEKLTEDNVVAAAVNYSRGLLPSVNSILCLTDPNLHALDHVPYVHRSILHPILALKILYYKLIKLMGCKPFYKYFPTIENDIQLILIMFLYSVVSSSNLLYFSPLVFYYATFLIMGITTFQMLQMKRDFYDFRVWSALFITYSGGSLNANEAEYQFICNNLKPYAHFFMALFINLVIYPIIADQWIPQSELTIIAFSLTFMTLHSFMMRKRHQTIPDLLLLFSFAINVLAKYPYETDAVVTQGWRYLDLKIPSFASYVIGNGIEFCINFRIVFYIFIPILFLRIASRDNWRGTYKYLIPHCVTLSWLQIFIINSQGATMFGLARGTLALVGIVLFLPLVGLTTIILPAVALTKWLVTSISLYSLCIFIMFSVIGLGITWLFAKTRFSQFIAYVQILIGITTFCILLNSVFVKNLSKDNFSHESSISSLGWDQYQNFCHQPAWESDTVAVTQMRCSKLANVEVEWEGYINEIKLKSVTNNFKNIIDYLPSSLNQYFYCLYGDTIEHDCENVPGLLENDCLALYNAIKSTQRCSLDRFNVYHFEITVRMHSGLWGKTAEVILSVSHDFKNFTLHLKPNDKIQFKGLLTNYDVYGNSNILGGANPVILLKEIKCVACHNNKILNRKHSTEKSFSLSIITSNVFQGIKFLLNFLFHPVIVFR